MSAFRSESEDRLWRARVAAGVDSVGRAAHPGPMPKPITAIVYDFDGTLSPGSMQEHTLLPELGFAAPTEFWKEVKAECRRREGSLRHFPTT